MIKQYGHDKGREVFYASKNAGKITGVDTKEDDNQHMGFSKGEATPVEQLITHCDALAVRLDAFERRRAMRRPEKVKPRTKDGMQPSNRHPKEISG